MEKKMIRRCPDIHKSYTESRKLMQEYRENGYDVEELILPFFKLLLDDGYVLITLEDGYFWSQCFPY